MCADNSCFVQRQCDDRDRFSGIISVGQYNIYALVGTPNEVQYGIFVFREYRVH